MSIRIIKYPKTFRNFRKCCWHINISLSFLLFICKVLFIFSPLKSSLNLINNLFNGVAMTWIYGDASHMLIKKGANIFSKNRNPIFCSYITNNNTYTAFILSTGTSSSSFDFVPIIIHGAQTTLTASVLDNGDIKVQGLGSWGFGVAFGLRVGIN